MKRLLFVGVSAIQVFAAASASAGLPGSWESVFTPDPNWKVSCNYKLPPGTPIASCRAPALVYYGPASQTGEGTDIIVHMLYDHRRLWPSLAVPHDGCKGGTVAIDGKTIMTLAESHGACTPADGKVFAGDDVSVTAYVIPRSNLENGTEMEITLDLNSGETVTATVPLSGFAAAFHELPQGGGGRR